MNKWILKKIFRRVMSTLPMWSHRLLTKKKILQLSEHLMTIEDLELCEKNIEKRDMMVIQYKQRFPKATKVLERKIEELIQHNPLVMDLPDLDETKKDIEFCWFGYGFHPDEYMFYQLGGENKLPQKRRMFVSEQERVCFRFSVNDFSDPLLSDKADVYKKFNEYYKRNALPIEKKTSIEELKSFLCDKTEFVQKYVSSSRGQAVELVQIRDIEISKYLDELKAKGKFLLEDRIIQSECLNVYGSSLHNIRVSTFRTKQGIIPICGFFTIGTEGTFVVNATIGCVFASIDCKTGLIESGGCDELGNRYDIHPSSGLKIKGFQLPDWDGAIRICIEVASKLDNFAYVSFDLAHTVNGWDIIEINPSGQLLHQAANLIGFRRELNRIVENMEQITPYKLRK